MARDPDPLPGSVLPPARTTGLGTFEKFMPGPPGAYPILPGEAAPQPVYPNKSVHMGSFIMLGLVPPFSSFFLEVLESYQIQLHHLTPNSIFILATFAYVCEMFIGVRPSLDLFRSFFFLSDQGNNIVGGCAFQPRTNAPHRFIQMKLPSKWENWKMDWVYTKLDDHPRLRLPTAAPVKQEFWVECPVLGPRFDGVLTVLGSLRSRGLTSHMVFGDYTRRRIAPLRRCAEPAWMYRGITDPLRVQTGVGTDWAAASLKVIIWKVLHENDVSTTLIPDSILPLCCNVDRDGIIQALETAARDEGRSGAGAGGGGDDDDDDDDVPIGMRGHRGAPRSMDPKDKGKKKVGAPPSPPRGGGAERVTAPRQPGVQPAAPGAQRPGVRPSAPGLQGSGMRPPAPSPQVPGTRPVAAKSQGPKPRPTTSEPQGQGARRAASNPQGLGARSATPGPQGPVARPTGPPSQPEEKKKRRLYRGGEPVRPRSAGDQNQPPSPPAKKRRAERERPSKGVPEVGKITGPQWSFQPAGR